MLVVMTMNWWLCASVVAGAAGGYLAAERWRWARRASRPSATKMEAGGRGTVRPQVVVSAETDGSGSSSSDYESCHVRQ